MRIGASGQVTIPEDIRLLAGLGPQTEFDIDYDGESIRIVPRTDDVRSMTPLLSPEEIRALLGVS